MGRRLGLVDCAARWRARDRVGNWGGQALTVKSFYDEVLRSAPDKIPDAG